MFPRVPPSSSGRPDVRLMGSRRAKPGSAGGCLLRAAVPIRCLTRPALRSCRSRASDAPAQQAYKNKSDCDGSPEGHTDPDRRLSARRRVGLGEWRGERSRHDRQRQGPPARSENSGRHVYDGKYRSRRSLEQRRAFVGSQDRDEHRDQVSRSDDKGNETTTH